VLTLSDVSAIKISDVDALIAAGLNPNAVAAELARVTFEQFFVTGFFHADPHPGNIFVKPMPAESGIDFKLTFIDFGMMGEINEDLRNNLQRFLFAVASRDARGWVAACERLGVLLPSADTVILERAISELFDRFGGVGVGELVQTDPRELREFALRFSELLRTLPFQLPNDFLFLIRALSLISGVASTLNREFNIWDAIDPFARSLLNGAGSGVAKNLGKEFLSFASTVGRLPGRIDDLISRLDAGQVIIRNPELETRMRVLDSSLRRGTSALLFTGLLIGGLMINGQNESLSYWLLGISVVPLIHALGFGRISR
jgi:predicted unusual protein kinase regulating ubiquinone biosynthesis (AarF/ABC1/UbiB family)